MRERLIGARVLLVRLQRFRRNEQHCRFARLAFLQPRGAEVREHAELVHVRELAPLLLAQSEQCEARKLTLMALEKCRGGRDLLSQRV